MLFMYPVHIDNKFTLTQHYNFGVQNGGSGLVGITLSMICADELLVNVKSIIREYLF